RNENAHRTEPRRPAFRSLDFLRWNESVSAITQHHRSARKARHPIHHRRAQPGAGSSGEDDSRHTEVAFRVRKVSRGWNYEFAWQRQDRAFDRHEQRDDWIATRFQGIQIPVDEAFEHGGAAYILLSIQRKITCGQNAHFSSAEKAINF